LSSEPKKVAFLAHCLLNQNSKTDEGAYAPAMFRPVIDVLREHGYTLRQMPCPELAYAGARRFWGVKDQYDTPLYRRHCRRLAKLVASVMEPHLRAGDDVVLVGVDTSPTMGADFTPTAPNWGGRPDRIEDDSRLVAGKGIFLEELEDELAERGLELPRRAGTRHWWPDYDPDEERRRLEALLDGEAERSVRP
jgi:predicted secreted protein